MKQLLAPEENPGYEPEKAAQSTSMSIWSITLILISLVLVLLGLFGPSMTGASVLSEMSFFALAAVVGIWARIAQAQSHHRDLMKAVERPGADTGDSGL